jgi:glycosyltransferase involved in cell wall biosynthesis
VVLERHPTVRVVVCGEDRSAYGPAPAGGSWVRHLLDELQGRLDLSRVHFLGLLPHAALLNLFRFSTAHVYLTAPYVLSWSLLEAMACGALVVGSQTAPVQEVVEHGVEGLLVPFDQPQELAATLLQVLAQPAAFAHLRLGARRRIVRDFDHRVCLARQIELITTAARGIDPLSANEAGARA